MDKKYWTEFYKNKNNVDQLNTPSTFAVFCNDSFFKDKNSIVDLGCGSGRDSVYFSSKEKNVYAIDQALYGLTHYVTHIENIDNITLLEEDFITYDYTGLDNIDGFYSRFTIHSITQEEEDIILTNIYNNLSTGGLFACEVRTTKDPLCGVGEHICDTTYMTDHKRRFIDSSSFINKCLGMGFNLKYFTEEDNLSVYKDDNPVLMRVILEK